MSDPSAPLTPQQLFYLCQPPNIYSLKCPAAPAPSGMVPLDRNGPKILDFTIGVSVASTFVILVATLIRFYARSVILKTFTLEDGLVILSLISFFVFIPFFFAAAPVGLGQHTWNVTISDLFSFLHRQYSAQILYSFSIYPAKIAIILQIMRIFDTKHGRKGDWVYWGSWSMIVFTTAYSLAGLILCIFPCRPIHRLWDQTLPGTCISPMIPGAIGAVGNLISDLIVLALPILGVRNLQMRPKKKVAVSAVFAIGFFTCILAAIRLYFTVKKDWLDRDYLRWVTVEATIAIGESGAITLCCCFPSLPLFWKHMSRSEISGWNNSSAKTENFQLSRGAITTGHIGKRSSNARYWDMGTGEDDNATSKAESQENITTVKST